MSGAGLATALRARRARGAAIIAEIKARSGEGRDLLRGRSAAELARAYAEGGAACLSVVTGKWFGGTPALLEEAAAACQVPILCKDFIRGPRDVVAMAGRGASAVLVTLRVLPDVAARAVLDACAEHGIDAMVEAASPEELARARGLGASVVSINNLDIADRERSGEGLERSLRLRGGADDRLWISASGIDGVDAAARVAAAGFDALLVGTWLLDREDPAAGVRELVDATSTAPVIRRRTAAGGLLKVCGVSRADEIDALAALGVDLVGLCDLPGEPYAVDLPHARVLAERCPRRTVPVLVTLERDPARLAEAIEAVGAPAVQLAGLTRPRHVAELRARLPSSALFIMQSLRERDGKLLEQPMIDGYAEAGVDLFVIDRVGDGGRLGSSGRPVADDLIDGLAAARLPRPYLLAGGLSAVDVAPRLRRAAAAGADVLSSVRDGDGIAPDAVAAFARALRDGAHP